MDKEHVEENGQEKNDVWGKIYEAVYDPTPEINDDSLRRFLKTMKKIRSRSSVSMLVDTAVRLNNCFYSFICVVPIN